MAMPRETIFCGSMPVMSSPANSMVPPLTPTRPLMERSAVDLPAPLAPMSVDDLALLDGEGDALEGFDAAVADFQIRYFEQAHSSSTPRYACMTSGSSCTSAGVPSAMSLPKSIT